MTDRKTIRDVVEALLKENAELRQSAFANGLILGVGFAGRDAARALLRDLDGLEVRITEYLDANLPKATEGAKP